MKTSTKKKTFKKTSGERKIIDDIFFDIIEKDEITCWRNHKKQKYDIMIRIRGNLKGLV